MTLVEQYEKCILDMDAEYDNGCGECRGCKYDGHGYCTLWSEVADYLRAYETADGTQFLCDPTRLAPPDDDDVWYFGNGVVLMNQFTFQKFYEERFEQGVLEKGRLRFGSLIKDGSVGRSDDDPTG